MGLAKILFIEDRSKRIHTAIKKYSKENGFHLWIAPNVKEALRAMSNENWDIVSLDHDLNGDDYQKSSDPTCGMEIVRWVLNCGWPHERQPLFIIHTHNLFVIKQMTNFLVSAGFRASAVPFNYDEKVIEWMPFCRTSFERK